MSRTDGSPKSPDTAWLVTAHWQLDVAVAAAYGWSPDLTDDEILAALGDLHQHRQGASLENKDEGGNDAGEANGQQV